MGRCLQLKQIGDTSFEAETCSISTLCACNIGMFLPHTFSLALRMPSSPHKPLADSFCSLLVHNWCTTLPHHVLRRTCIVLQSVYKIIVLSVPLLLVLFPLREKELLHQELHPPCTMLYHLYSCLLD